MVWFGLCRMCVELCRIWDVSLIQPFKRDLFMEQKALFLQKILKIEKVKNIIYSYSNMRTCEHIPNKPICEHANMQTCKHANMCEYANIQTCEHEKKRTFEHANMRTCEDANMRACEDAKM